MNQAITHTHTHTYNILKVVKTNSLNLDSIGLHIKGRENSRHEKVRGGLIESQCRGSCTSSIKLDCILVCSYDYVNKTHTHLTKRIFDHSFSHTHTHTQTFIVSVHKHRLTESLIERN